MGINIKKTPAPQDQASQGASSMPGNLIKTGAQAAAALDEEKQKAAARQDANSKTFRYFMKPGTENMITFLDGDLDSETKMFKQPFVREHNVFMNGRWNTHILCVSDNEPCPLCESASDQTQKVSPGALIAFFTIIDHSEYQASNGNVYANQIRLFAAKRQTVMMLAKHAEKNGGSLAGCTFEVSRSNDKSANVGDVFILDQKNSMEDIVASFEERNDKGEVTKAIAPLDYESEVIYKSADELRQMGFGHGGGNAIPSSDSVGGAGDASGQNYSDQM